MNKLKEVKTTIGTVVLIINNGTPIIRPNDQPVIAMNINEPLRYSFWIKF